MRDYPRAPSHQWEQLRDGVQNASEAAGARIRELEAKLAQAESALAEKQAINERLVADIARHTAREE